MLTRGLLKTDVFRPWRRLPQRYNLANNDACSIRKAHGPNVSFFTIPLVSKMLDAIFREKLQEELLKASCWTLPYPIDASDYIVCIDSFLNPACGRALLRTYRLVFPGWTKILSLHPLPCIEIKITHRREGCSIALTEKDTKVQKRR